MKKHFTLFKKMILIICIGIFISTGLNAQDLITRWNFNGPAADQIPGGAESPSTQNGVGVAALTGGTTATFASGVASGGSSDPETTSPPNYGWNSSTYPAQGTLPKTAGVQFHVSTLGYEHISFVFDQRLSNTAANTWMMQYCTDVNASTPEWIDGQLFTVVPQPTGTGDTWFNQRTVDLTAISALNNNANAGFRVVSDFDPTAGAYLAARSTSSYGPAGTSRFDMVSIFGSLITSNIENYLANAKIIYQYQQLSIQLPQSVTGDLTITDIHGRLIHNQRIDGNQFAVSMQLPSAMIIVSIHDKSGNSYSKKLIIN